MNIYLIRRLAKEWNPHATLRMNITSNIRCNKTLRCHASSQVYKWGSSRKTVMGLLHSAYTFKQCGGFCDIFPFSPWSRHEFCPVASVVLLSCICILRLPPEEYQEIHLRWSRLKLNVRMWNPQRSPILTKAQLIYPTCTPLVNQWKKKFTTVQHVGRVFVKRVISNNTNGYTQERNRTTAHSAGRILLARAISRDTSAFTQEKSRISALSVRRGLLKVVFS